MDIKHCQQQEITSIVAIEMRIFDCGLKFKLVKVCNGLGSRTTALILNIYQQLYSKFLALLKIARLLNNMVLITQFFIANYSLNYFGIINTCLQLPS